MKPVFGIALGLLVTLGIGWVWGVTGRAAANRALRDVATALHHRLGRITRQVRRDRDDGNDKEDHQAGSLQVVVSSRMGHKEERKRETKPDGRHVIEQQVHMRRIRQQLDHGMLPLQTADRSDVCEETARRNRPEPTDERRDGQQLGVC